ncbi:adenosine kinase [Coccidioides immitis RS]|uniref:Adenosine kinase n=5 Tax=Coccidioides TaxID=5500 RepID=J3K798_COCIM|nr:adenosine kinase [Coccidioides immitis RS]XP_003069416.1 kinase, pfkB family protein [Coccidioides posadasii C735 delta SOWgp]KMM67034.1 adenosine kinase [Coccidioides posadasii RMSCC 3488]KMP03099.1 adenosine kinase [Coccidioides immitis RMSCC 2394]KMU84671.1 adenosine kinase [Coccidioides immitis H538.4]TPX23490.1 adenosine kinase [Coccidioides immitis]EAS30552.3 adenosine kinase [Coccidioides immitis RS]|eukprot:XP_003069416.1 kinase, pfkB family protein [Coccidioides posadasii C735 delta SOWgp]
MAAPEGYPLLCLENPLLDIQGVGNEAMLEKYGVKANDAILAEEKHMGLYEDLLQNCGAKLIAGGAAQNTARGAQYMLPDNSVVYMGCVGKDKYADILRDAGSKAGIRTEYRVDDVQPTGRCGVIITGHNRSLVTHLAAANEYKLDHLKQPEIWSLVEKAKYFFVGGFHLTVCVPAIMALAEEAAEKNKTFILSLSAPFIPAVFKDPLDQVFPYTDYIVGNESEALAFSEAHGWGISDLTEIAKKMANLPKKNSQRPRTVIITHGTEPTISAVSDGNGGAEVKTTAIRKISQDEIYDTNGAGDAFAGGFCAGVVQGKTLDECLDMGHWLANLSIRELGPQFPFPKKTYTS